MTPLDVSLTGKWGQTLRDNTGDNARIGVIDCAGGVSCWDTLTLNSEKPILYFKHTKKPSTL